MEACVSKYHRLHSTSCSTEPAAIVDHFAGSGARRLHFGWKHKKDEWIVIRCQSVWTCFSLRKWFFSASWRNILRASRASPPDPTGALPRPPASAPPQTKILDPPLVSVCLSVSRSFVRRITATNNQPISLKLGTMIGPTNRNN